MDVDPQFKKELKLFLSEEQLSRIKHAAIDLDVDKLSPSVTGGNRNPNVSMLVRHWIETHITST